MPRPLSLADEVETAWVTPVKQGACQSRLRRLPCMAATRHHPRPVLVARMMIGENRAPTPAGCAAFPYLELESHTR